MSTLVSNRQTSVTARRDLEKDQDVTVFWVLVRATWLSSLELRYPGTGTFIPITRFRMLRSR